MNAVGYISSVQSMGTLDGPGVRFVAFLQGCNLRCGCCHNPETQEMLGGMEYTADALVEKVLRYKSYFGKDGGITLSGGEPLLQADFSAQVFSKCKEAGINTCLDTSGSILNDDVKKLLAVTDRVLLDIKYHTDSLYREYAGCSLQKPIEFLSYLNSEGIATTVRQVIIPQLNGNDDDVEFLKDIIKSYTCIDKIELLPFKKICKSKYDNLERCFPFENYDTPTAECVKKLQAEVEKGFCER